MGFVGEAEEGAGVWVYVGGVREGDGEEGSRDDGRSEKVRHCVECGVEVLLEPLASSSNGLLCRVNYIISSSRHLISLEGIIFRSLFPHSFPNRTVIKPS